MSNKIKITNAHIMAARNHAANNPSDPFAYGRMICHMRAGIVTLDDFKQPKESK